MTQARLINCFCYVLAITGSNWKTNDSQKTGSKINKSISFVKVPVDQVDRILEQFQS